MSSKEISTRNRILKAAWALLDSNPGVAARMSDIAKAAGVSRQALYLHFPNRTELFIATTLYQDEQLDIQRALGKSREATTGKERLAAFITAWGGHIPKIYGIAKTLIVMKATDEDAARAWDKRMADMREGCQAAIAALARDGALTPEMTETEATDFLWSLLSVSNWELLTVDCGWQQAQYLDHIQRAALQVLIR